MRFKMVKQIIILIVFFVTIYPISSMADTEAYEKALGGPQRGYDYELDKIAPYCKCFISSNRDQYKNDRAKWDAVFKKNGGTGLHFNHYCQGLLALYRLGRGVGESKALLGFANYQFKYVLKNLNPRHFMLPEVHTKMGITQKMLGQNDMAVNEFYQAVKLNKKYVPAYIGLIDLYKMIGDLNAAVKIARTGLKYSPDSKILKRKLLELK